MSSLECKVYVKELRPLGYGLPLFEPNPAEYDHVRIGDVGIADRDGYFMRIFNCFAQADHDINARFGVPEGFRPLEDKFRLTKPRQALEPGHWYKSHHIHEIEGSVDFSVTNSPIGMKANFTASNQQGAAFYLEHRAERTDATRLLTFRKYMLRHFESWEQFLHNMDFQFELQDIVFVTGHDLTANWATATRVHRKSVGSLAVTFGDIMATLAASLSRSSESFFEIPVRIGPNPYNPPERHHLLEGDASSPGAAEPFKDQCLFLRGYRVAKRPILPAKLRAAAGPDKLDMDGDDDTYTDVVPIGFDPDEENQIVEDIVDHDFAMDLIFKHTNAEIAIINESDVCLLAKAAENSTKQLSLWNHKDFRAIGLLVEAEFDSELQKTVGTLKTSLSAATASDNAASIILPYKDSVANGERDYKDDNFIGPMPSIHTLSLFDTEQAITNNECVYEDENLTDPRVSKWNGKRAASVPNMELPKKEVEEAWLLRRLFDLLVIIMGGTVRSLLGQVGGNVTHVRRPTDMILSRHNSVVWAVAFSPDGSRIVSGSSDHTVRLWDYVTGTQLGEPLRGHNKGVNSVAFSPDGSRIASGSSDRTIRLWDTVTSMQVGEPLYGHGSWVQSVAFSPDGSLIASGSLDGTIRLWDAATGMQVGEPLRGGGPVESVTFSPDGSRIVSGSSDHTVRLWDSVTGTQLGEPLRGHNKGVNSVAFSPDGNRIASGSSDRTIRLWDDATGMQVGEPLRGHDGPVESVAFSPGGSHIASGSQDETIRLWDAVTGMQVTAPRHRHYSNVWSVAFSPDGKRVASGSSDRTVQIWEIAEILPAGPQQ